MTQRLRLLSLALLTSDRLSVFDSKCVRNLGVLSDSRLTLEKHVSSVVASSFFQLRLLSKIKHFLPEKPLETAVHRFFPHNWTLSIVASQSPKWLVYNWSKMQQPHFLKNATNMILPPPFCELFIGSWVYTYIYIYIYIWVKIIDFSFMPKVIRILSKHHVLWRYFVNILP